MLQKRPAEERGHVDHGWLDTRHTFSFASYRDPAHTGFGPLRVLNDDRVVPGAGFGTHGHRDMEIVSYVVTGRLAHRDSMGNGSELGPGDVQRMSAGTGITHSEFNASPEEGLRFLQIWIEPDRDGIEPGWEEKHFDRESRTGQLRLLAAPGAPDGALDIHQDVRVYAAILEGATQLAHPIESGRRVWVQVVDGELNVNGTPMKEGDGLAMTGESEVRLDTGRGAEILLFDLA